MILLRISDAAQATNLSPNTLRKYADMGFLPVVWVGNQRRFRQSDLEALVTHGIPRLDRRIRRIQTSRRGRGIAILREHHASIKA